MIVVNPYLCPGNSKPLNYLTSTARVFILHVHVIKNFRLKHWYEYAGKTSRMHILVYLEVVGVWLIVHTCAYAYVL